MCSKRWVIEYWVIGYYTWLLCLLWQSSAYPDILTYIHVFLNRIVLQQSTMCTLSTALSPGHDLPSLHLVCVRLQSPQASYTGLSQCRHVVRLFLFRRLLFAYCISLLTLHLLLQEISDYMSPACHEQVRVGLLSSTLRPHTLVP